MGDPILPTEGLENEHDRKLRHYAEGKAAWATVESLNTLDIKVDGVLRLLKGDEADPSNTGGLVGAVSKIMGYLQDSYDAAGNPTKGALNRVNALWTERNFMRTLAVGALAVLIGQFAIQGLNFYYTHVAQTPVPVTVKQHP